MQKKLESLRLIKKPEESFFLKENSDISKEESKKLFEALSKRFSEVRDDAQRESLELTEDFQEKIIKTYIFAKKEFANRGTSEVKFLPAFLHSFKKDNGTSGGVKEGSISVFTPEEIGKEQLNQIYLLDVLTHEVYHSSALAKFDALRNQEGYRLLAKHVSQGANYNANNGALEEGLATLFQKNLRNQIKTLFQNEISGSYVLGQNRAIEYWLTQGVSREDIDIFTPPVFFTENEEEIKWYPAHFRYIPCVKLVQYLSEKFTENNLEFFNLIEKFRIEGESVEIEKVFTELFDSNSFKALLTSSVEESESLLKKLQQSYKKQL